MQKLVFDLQYYCHQ